MRILFSIAVSLCLAQPVSSKNIDKKEKSNGASIMFDHTDGYHDEIYPVSNPGAENPEHPLGYEMNPVTDGLDSTGRRQDEGMGILISPGDSGTDVNLSIGSEVKLFTGSDVKLFTESDINLSTPRLTSLVNNNSNVSVSTGNDVTSSIGSDVKILTESDVTVTYDKIVNDSAAITVAKNVRNNLSEQPPNLYSSSTDKLSDKSLDDIFHTENETSTQISPVKDFPRGIDGDRELRLNSEPDSTATEQKYSHKVNNSSDFIENTNILDAKLDPTASGIQNGLPETEYHRMANKKLLGVNKRKELYSESQPHNHETNYRLSLTEAKLNVRNNIESTLSSSAKSTHQGVNVTSSDAVGDKVDHRNPERRNEKVTQSISGDAANRNAKFNLFDISKSNSSRALEKVSSIIGDVAKRNRNRNILDFSNNSRVIENPAMLESKELEVDSKDVSNSQRKAIKDATAAKSAFEESSVAAPAGGAIAQVVENLTSGPTAEREIEIVAAEPGQQERDITKAVERKTVAISGKEEPTTATASSQEVEISSNQKLIAKETAEQGIMAAAAGHIQRATATQVPIATDSADHQNETPGTETQPQDPSGSEVSSQIKTLAAVTGIEQTSAEAIPTDQQLLAASVAQKAIETSAARSAAILPKSRQFADPASRGDSDYNNNYYSDYSTYYVDLGKVGVADTYNSNIEGGVEAVSVQQEGRMAYDGKTGEGAGEQSSEKFDYRPVENETGSNTKHDRRDYNFGFTRHSYVFHLGRKIPIRGVTNLHGDSHVMSIHWYDNGQKEALAVFAWIGLTFAIIIFVTLVCRYRHYMMSCIRYAGYLHASYKRGRQASMGVEEVNDLLSNAQV